MGFFSKVFGSPSSGIEKELEAQYVPMFQEMMSMSLSQAKSNFRDIFKQIKEESVKDGTANLPQNFGDIMLEKESTDEKIKSRLKKRRNEGVRDEDIKWWWNMHDLERLMMLKVDELYRFTLFMKLREDGINGEKAVKEVSKFNPMYGDPDDTSRVTGDDRLLPVELKDRVNRYIENKAQTDSEGFQKEIKKSSSFNALVRKEIREGNL